MSPNTPQFLILTAAGWLNRHQQAALAYLQAENAVLREQLTADRRNPRFTDKQRRRLARAAKGIPRRVLRGLGTIVTPDTLLKMVPAARRQIRRKSTFRRSSYASIPIAKVRQSRCRSPHAQRFTAYLGRPNIETGREEFCEERTVLQIAEKMVICKDD